MNFTFVPFFLSNAMSSCSFNNLINVQTCLTCLHVIERHWLLMICTINWGQTVMAFGLFRHDFIILFVFLFFCQITRTMYIINGEIGECFHVVWIKLKSNQNIISFVYVRLDCISIYSIFYERRIKTFKVYFWVDWVELGNYHAIRIVRQVYRIPETIWHNRVNNVRNVKNPIGNQTPNFSQNGISYHRLQKFPQRQEQKTKNTRTKYMNLSYLKRHTIDTAHGMK